MKECWCLLKFWRGKGLLMSAVVMESNSWRASKVSPGEVMQQWVSVTLEMSELLLLESPLMWNQGVRSSPAQSIWCLFGFSKVHFINSLSHVSSIGDFNKNRLNNLFAVSKFSVYCAALSAPSGKYNMSTGMLKVAEHTDSLNSGPPGTNEVWNKH